MRHLVSVLVAILVISNVEAARSKTTTYKAPTYYQAPTYYKTPTYYTPAYVAPVAYYYKAPVYVAPVYSPPVSYGYTPANAYSY